MKQQHMKPELFHSILDNLRPGKHVVSLQGEGEPTVHPKFWEMVRLVMHLGHIPYTITNGSLIDPVLANKYFPNLGVSLDTLDDYEADRIGRLKLPQVLARLDALMAIMSSSRIVIHTVDMGQDLVPIKQFVRERNLRHVVQPLQRKSDYARLYLDRARLAAQNRSISRTCRILFNDRMRYFDVGGREYPCCFIKDPSSYVGIDDLRNSMIVGMTPAACNGCAEILVDT